MSDFGDSVQTISVTMDKDTTGEIACPGRGGLVIVPATSTGLTSLTYYTAEKSGGTRVPLCDSVGAAVTQTVVPGNAYDMPAATFGCRVLYLKGNAAKPVFVTERN